ncbi:MAG: metallophosphoesterase [Culturomica sp.]|jgi:hypothetical protein|nr:metallophosphoesterase [Culturomica sp.]
MTWKMFRKNDNYLERDKRNHTMKKYTWLLWILLLAGMTLPHPAAAAQRKEQATVIEGHGDLYVLHNPDKSVRIIAAKADGKLLDTTFLRLPENLKLRYFAADESTDLHFEFSLHGRIKHNWRQEPAEKTVVVSDLHGRLDAFVALLQGNGVVDKELNWSYGKNRLIFLGDMLDRGRDDNGIAWLVYKLEKEAEQAGGGVDFLPGNHEDMVLKDDIRYVNEAHLAFAAKAGIPYAGLYGPDTELGRWIRDSYLILVVGDNLFVHAGLSPELIRRGYKIGEINELAWRFTGYPNRQRNELHPRNEFLFGSGGPLWYRGMVSDLQDNSPILPEELEQVLRYYNVKRVVAGHTEVDETGRRYNDRVVTVNVRHYDNYPKDRTAGLLIEAHRFYAVTYSGAKELLPE